MTAPKTGKKGKRSSASPHQFDLLDEVRRLFQAEPCRRVGRNAKTLVKRDDLRIVLTVMKAGNRLQGHQAAARISIQALTGRIRLQLPGRSVELPAGHLLTLDRGVEHDVEALEESAFLLSLWWPQPH